MRFGLTITTATALGGNGEEACCQEDGEMCVWTFKKRTWSKRLFI